MSDNTLSRRNTLHCLGAGALAGTGACSTPAPVSAGLPASLSVSLSASLAKAFAPNDKLRASINLGNPILANRQAGSGEPFGVSIDLANEFARRLGVGVDLVVFDGAAKSVEAVKSEQADVGFFAIDPVRSEGLNFTAPYVLIEGSYLVRHSSALQSPLARRNAANSLPTLAGNSTRGAVISGRSVYSLLTRDLYHSSTAGPRTQI